MIFDWVEQRDCQCSGAIVLCEVVGHGPHGY